MLDDSDLQPNKALCVMDGADRKVGHFGVALEPNRGDRDRIAQPLPTLL